MRKGGRTIIAILLCLAIGSTAASASALPETIATFADPGTTSFTFTANTGIMGRGQLDGHNDGIVKPIVLGVLNGPLAPTTFSNVSFKLTDTDGDLLDVMAITYKLNGILLKADFEPGILEIYDNNNDNALILGATFDSAKLTPVSVGSKFSITKTSTNIVHFYGPAVDENTAGTFSFALVTVDNPLAFKQPLKDFHATASFNCSAIWVPEPGTIILLGGGIFAVAGIAARRFRRARAH